VTSLIVGWVLSKDAVAVTGSVLSQSSAAADAQLLVEHLVEPLLLRVERRKPLLFDRVGSGFWREIPFCRLDVADRRWRHCRGDYSRVLSQGMGRDKGASQGKDDQKFKHGVAPLRPAELGRETRLLPTGRAPGLLIR
jgi:hypothetical protein